jgi:prophage maintenance system killer protein
MYTNIEPLSDFERNFQSDELSALGRVWLEKKGDLEKSGEFKQFLKKLQREWAIETGIIERLYSWDRGVTEVLIEQGVDSALIAHRGGLDSSQAEKVSAIIHDQIDIIEGLFGYVSGEQKLSEHFIRNMQAQFTKNQHFVDAVSPDSSLVKIPILRGEYKKLPNNPRRQDGSIHTYSPPEFVKDEMERLVAWQKDYETDVSPEVLAAWLHHRFTQIHPFQDGNGRVARALGTLIFLKAGLFPLVIRDTDRTRYISALESSDEGDLKPLVELFAQRQRSAILAALGLEQQVRQQGFAEEIMSSAVQILRTKFEQRDIKISESYKIAEQLCIVATKRLEELSAVLNNYFSELCERRTKNYTSNVKSAENTSPIRHYYYSQIISVANQMNYYAVMDPYRSWTRLVISTDQLFELVISFHSLGSSKSGILVASAFTFERISSEEAKSEFVNIISATPDVFQFNYAESSESIRKRFQDWLETATAIAFSEWKKRIES